MTKPNPHTIVLAYHPDLDAYAQMVRAGLPGSGWVEVDEAGQTKAQQPAGVSTDVKKKAARQTAHAPKKAAEAVPDPYTEPQPGEDITTTHEEN